MKALLLKMAMVAAALALGGCASYTYNGVEYNSRNDLMQAVETAHGKSLAQVVPLQRALSAKKLIVAIPSADTSYREKTRTFNLQFGNDPSFISDAEFATQALASHRENKGLADALAKKNIFSSVQLLDRQSRAGTIVPADDADTLYLIYTGADVSRWYYDSQRSGRQELSYDQTSLTTEGRMQAFIDAVLAQVIRQ
ncbi:hypothetical protein [Janthinobacterium agaricidamnosum]|uniref:Putative lipoprotein n=1 Tax=Janthinobacterium agaricidamnosum NBRC 102515 = DSM 9628 TaxID=1349767 RepID=W0UWP3_9BURK|nr:hypothetical protein [Janthinobacterium agaricidamnosum]CDG80834.1 putative lipoprotein [Janthinobacterium agaricidamnosum NBRC 102515 = DSM 9628]